MIIHLCIMLYIAKYERISCNYITCKITLILNKSNLLYIHNYFCIKIIAVVFECTLFAFTLDSILLVSTIIIAETNN